MWKLELMVTCRVNGDLIKARGACHQNHNVSLPQRILTLPQTFRRIINGIYVWWMLDKYAVAWGFEARILMLNLPGPHDGYPLLINPMSAYLSPGTGEQWQLIQSEAGSRPLLLMAPRDTGKKWGRGHSGLDRLMYGGWRAWEQHLSPLILPKS